MKFVYLDNSTTARPSGEAISKMLTFYSEKWGTPYQPHTLGQETFPPLKEALHSVYQLLGAIDQDTVVITSSSAEAVNQAIFSTFQNTSLMDGKNHFITTLIEEAPMMMSLRRLEALDCAATFLKPNAQGIITAKALTEAVTPRTAMLCLSWANGLTGVVQPIAELAEICKLRGIKLLVEATHVLGKLFFELKDLPIDFIAFNGEQLHAPKGTGGLYSRHGVKLSPFIIGGIEQAGLRAGSINVPATVALGVAAKQALEARDYVCTEVARLKMLFEKQLQKRLPDIKILFENEERVPHITAISFPGVSNEALLFLLNRKSVYASLGGGSQQQIGFMLSACGFDPLVANSALSFSFSRETTEQEIDYAVQAIEAGYLRLKKASNHL